MLAICLSTHVHYPFKLQAAIIYYFDGKFFKSFLKLISLFRFSISEQYFNVLKLCGFEELLITMYSAIFLLTIFCYVKQIVLSLVLVLLKLQFMMHSTRLKTQLHQGQDLV